MEEFVSIVLPFMIGLALGYIIYAIGKNINDHENDIKWLKQRIFELEDKVKELNGKKYELRKEA